MKLSVLQYWLLINGEYTNCLIYADGGGSFTDMVQTYKIFWGSLALLLFDNKGLF